VSNAATADFTGLMGDAGMESAVAVIVEKARREGRSLADVRFKSRDFDLHGIAVDGFFVLWWHGWLEQRAGDLGVAFSEYAASRELIERIERWLERA